MAAELLLQNDRHDLPWLVDEPIPCLAAVVDHVIVGLEDAIPQL